MNNQTNYTMLCDFYELSMANGYFQTPLKDCITYFDVFFRTIPDEGGFAITAGLEQVVNYIQNLTFTGTRTSNTSVPKAASWKNFWTT